MAMMCDSIFGVYMGSKQRSITSKTSSMYRYIHRYRYMYRYIQHFMQIDAGRLYVKLLNAAACWCYDRPLWEMLGRGLL